MTTIRKKSENPKRLTIQPPKSGNSIGRMFPAPDRPVYKALFLFVVTSSKTPDTAIR